MPEVLLDAPPLRAGNPARWLLVGVVVALLFAVGTYDEPIHAFLTQAWQRALAAIGLQATAEALQSRISGGIVKRFLPAVATYAVLYLALCLLLLRLLLNARQWRLAWRLYAAALLLYGFIVVLGRVSGNTPWVYRLARQILDFIFSPLPVAGLYVLFRSSFGTQPTASGSTRS